MAIILNMASCGPPGKGKDMPKECKVGRKRSSIRKSFKNKTVGKSVKLTTVKKEPPPDIPTKGEGTHSNPNRMYGTQVNIPNKAKMKRKLTGY